MSDAIIPSSPNWFLSNCICVGSDGYIVYGTLSVGIGILIPSEEKLSFKDFKVIRPAHKERVTSISLCPNWITSRIFVSGAEDGLVKLWSAETLASRIAHNTHSINKETVIAVAFLDAHSVVSVGSIGFVTVWHTKSNTIRHNYKALKFYRPMCMSVCPHKEKVIAVGMKQGVVIVLQISDNTMNILCKCPGHDSEVTSISWCPSLECEYLDNLKVNPKLNFKKKQCKVKFDEPESVENDKSQENDEESIETEIENDVQEESNNTTVLDTEEKVEDALDNTKDEEKRSPDFLKECNDLLNLIKTRKPAEEKDSQKSSSIFDNSDSDLDSQHSDDDRRKLVIDPSYVEVRNDESFQNSSILDSSDIFDIYEEPAFHEFGHTKFVGETISVKKNVQLPQHLDRKIIRAKKASLKTNSIINDNLEKLVEEVESLKIDEANKINNRSPYLASCCKKGNLCIWQWGGSLLLQKEIKKGSKDTKHKNNVSHPYGAILWTEPSKIIAATKDSKLVMCTFGEDMEISNLHNIHQRGLYTIASNNTDDGIIWTASMDRLLAGYSISDSSSTSYSTFGSFPYDIQLSNIDPSIFAVSGGDGVIRLFKMTEENDRIQTPTCLRQFWNGINGKIMSISWHPTKENCLAFSTVEGKVGLLKTSVDSPPRILPFSLPLGAYHICWGLSDLLFACGGGALIVYNTKNDNKPEEIVVNSMENGTKCKVSTMCWTERFLTVGTQQGGLALLNPEAPYDAKAFAHPHKHIISSLDWHPIAVTSEDGSSPCSDLIAISARTTNIVVMKLIQDEDKIRLEVFRDFSPHVEKVHTVRWSPHKNGILLTSSRDYTVQIWDILNDCLLHTYSDHNDSALCAVWCHSNPNHVISSSEDCSVRIWNINYHGPTDKSKIKKIKQKKKNILSSRFESDKNLAINKLSDQNQNNVPKEVSLKKADVDMATVSIASSKAERKINPMALSWKQYNSSNVEGCRRLLDKLTSGDQGIDYSNGYDYLRVFGSHEDVMELLNIEQSRHKEMFYWDAWVFVGILKGDLRGVLEQAAKDGRLSSSLLSIAPSVSHRFWKDTMASYCSQLEAGDAKLNEFSQMDNYGKQLWQALMYLSANQVEEGCSSLANAGLELEAIAAARARHVDHIAEKHIDIRLQRFISCGNFIKSAEGYLAKGNVMEAASILGKSNDESELALAAEMAGFGGNSLLSTLLKSKGSNT